MPRTETTPSETTAGETRIVAAIPARYGSTRLPGKPLAPLAGKPLIQHVYERTAAAPGLARVVVLTDDERIVEAVEGFGGDCQLTPAELPSGTDRIAHAAADWPEEAVLNVQGDWLIEPALIGRLATHLADHPDERMATLAVAATAAEMTEPAVVKVVCNLAGNALYFSRSPIPHPRHAAATPPLKHWGIYGYRRDTLLHLASLQPTPLERSESLEQLRALEHGIPIRVLRVDGVALGIDTPEDLARVQAALERRDGRS